MQCYQIELDKEQISPEIASPNYIINLASIVTAERDMLLFEGMIQSNLKVLLNLYERFKDDKSLKLFIQFGSSEEYGEIESPFYETAREEPNSPYALVKQLTTNTAMMLHRNYDFPMAVVRLGNLFGPLQNKSKFIPYVIEQLRNNQPLNVTLCEQKRDFIYVADSVVLYSRRYVEVGAQACVLFEPKLVHALYPVNLSVFEAEERHSLEYLFVIAQVLYSVVFCQ